MKYIAAFALLAGSFSPLYAAEILPPSVAVSGEAIAKLTPDQVTLPVTIQSEDVKLNTAKDANDKKLASVLALAKELKIPAEKMQTLGTQVMPQYDYPGSGNKPVFRNYLVNTTLNITLTDTSKLALLMDSLTKQNIDRIGGAQFGLQDEKKARDDLLVKAVQDARGKADKLATALGAKAGRPIYINENGGGFVPPRPPMPMMARGMAMEAKMADSSPELPGGEIEIRQNVNVTFALE